MKLLSGHFCDRDDPIGHAVCWEDACKCAKEVEELDEEEVGLFEQDVFFFLGRRAFCFSTSCCR